MTNETGLSAEQKQELQTKLIDALKTNADMKKIFCDCWPCAEDVLEILAKLKLPPIVTSVIKAIIAAGDFAHSKVCK